MTGSATDLEEHTKIIGAQKARMLVKNHCRTNTTINVFFVSVHDCRKNAIVGARAIGERWYQEVLERSTKVASGL